MIALKDVVGLGLDFILVATVIMLVRRLIMDADKKMPRDECEARLKLQDDKMDIFSEKFIMKIDHLTDLFTDYVAKK